MLLLDVLAHEHTRNYQNVQLQWLKYSVHVPQSISGLAGKTFHPCSSLWPVQIPTVILEQLSLSNLSHKREATIFMTAQIPICLILSMKINNCILSRMKYGPLTRCCNSLCFLLFENIFSVCSDYISPSISEIIRRRKVLYSWSSSSSCLYDQHIFEKLSQL